MTRSNPEGEGLLGPATLLGVVAGSHAPATDGMRLESHARNAATVMRLDTAPNMAGRTRLKAVRNAVVKTPNARADLPRIDDANRESGCEGDNRG